MKHLVVVSFDAMVTEDLDLLKDKPVFSRFLTEGSRVNRIRTIYPSLTYPAHTSMLTGARCGRHGVVNNEPSEVGNLKCDWYWFHDPVRIPDIHDAAKKAGLVTASVFWPVTGGHPGIDHLVAEYWAQGPADTLEKAYRRAGTSDDVFENVVRPVEKTMSSWEPESSDEGKVAMACAMIRRYRPDVLVTHDLDGEYGHPQHKITARHMEEAVRAAKDPSRYPESAGKYGVWEVKKLYIHLLDENAVYMDWDTPSQALGGRTPLEVATLGFQQHRSQQRAYSMDDGIIYDYTKFGLLYSAVGEDVNRNDLFENID